MASPSRDWQQLVETAPTRSYQRLGKDKKGLLARLVPKKAFDSGLPPSYLYASGNLNRCNPERVACVYFGEGPETARAEYDSYSHKPEPELGYYARVRLSAILDFENTATINHFGLISQDFTRSYVLRSGGLIPLQEIGLEVSKQTRILAIRYPSNAITRNEKKGCNLVIFQDLIQSPNLLEIMEGEDVLESWPK